MVKDEVFYIEMALRSVLDHANVLILDTGSKDGTVEKIKALQGQFDGKITLFEKDFGSNNYQGGEFRFALGFRQIEARDFLNDMALQTMGPDDFLIHIDGDEVVNERFWEILDKTDADAVCHATDLPLTPDKVSTHPLDMQVWGGHKLFDPHIRAWRIRTGARWKEGEFGNAMGAIHPRIDWPIPPVVEVTEDSVHFHLHYVFGPKSIYSYICPEEQTAEGAAKLLNVPLKEMHNQKYFEEHFPDWFKDGRFIPKNQDCILWNKHGRFAAPMSHPMPEFVVETWKKWGEWLSG